METKEPDYNIQLSVNTNTTPSRQQTFSPLHLIARQSTRFEVSFNLEQIYYSELKSLIMPKRIQLLSKATRNLSSKKLNCKKAIPHKTIAMRHSSEVILHTLLLQTLKMIKHVKLTVKFRLKSTECKKIEMRHQLMTLDLPWPVPLLFSSKLPGDEYKQRNVCDGQN